MAMDSNRHQAITWTNDDQNLSYNLDTQNETRPNTAL